MEPTLTTPCALVFHPSYLYYDVSMETHVRYGQTSFNVIPEPHPWSLPVVPRIKEFLDKSGIALQMRQIVPKLALDRQITAYHTQAYVVGIDEYANGGPSVGNWGSVEDDMPLNRSSLLAARYAVGGAIAAVDALMETDLGHAYALLHPPGHHATANRAIGFCIFNNAVIAAHHARSAFSVQRVMIVDWDVHHGNGTQDAFYEDPNVLFVSLHQDKWYPRNSGRLEEVGAGAGQGFTVNIPLPPGTGDRGYIAAFEQLVMPIGRQFRPELIIVSAGQDANWLDPLARMGVTVAGFRAMSGMMVELAKEVCGGKLIMLQEGGYSPLYVAYCTLAIIEQLIGIGSKVEEPYAGSSDLEWCQSVLTRDTRLALDGARQWQSQWWAL